MSASAEPVNVNDFIDKASFSPYQALILVLGFLSLAVDGFDNAVIGFVAVPLSQGLGVEPARLAPVQGIGPVGLALGALCAGPLADKIGRRTILIASLLIFGASSLCSTLIHTIGQLFWLRLGAGLGLGAAMPSAVALASEYLPQKRRSLLVTLMFCGFTLGSSSVGFVSPPLVARHGWQMVLFVGGVAPLALSLVLILVLPESARFLAANKAGAGARIARILNRISPHSVGPDQRFVVDDPGARRVRNPIASILSPQHRIGTLLLWLTYFMGLFVIILLLSWLPTLMHDAGFDQKSASSIPALFQLGGTAGALLVSLFMDKVGPHRSLAASYILGAVCLLTVSQSLHNVALLSFAILAAGFFISGSQSPMNALAAASYPTTARATGVSWMLGIGRWGAVLGGYVGGPLLQLGWGFERILASLAIPASIAAVAVAIKGVHAMRRTDQPAI